MMRLLPFVLLVFTIVGGTSTSHYSNRRRLVQDEASDTSRDDAASRSERSDEIWNAQHCQTKGCKAVTETMMSLMQAHDGASDNLINRNIMVDPLYHLPANMKPLPLTRNVDYLGVLLDAGRHYYPIDWIHNLLQVLHVMGYNLLHFRLTDDQAFNVQLDSMPALANPPLLDTEGRVYTASELRELVAYAKELDIVIMPEVTLPGHAAAWAGNHTPNLVVACPKYTCDRTHGVPLNLKHPKLLAIVRTVLKEILSIFSTSPYLHLGGGELQVPNQCLVEANYTDFDSDHERFEKELHDMLEKDLNFSTTNVIRWEATSFDQEEERMFVGTREIKRASEIAHYWFTKDYKERSSETSSSYFCSEGLYFDTNERASAWDIFGITRRKISEPKPRAVIAGTFELSTHQWMDRNIVGRLIAVAMGVSDQTLNSDSFKNSYGEMCRDLLHLDEGLCASEGVPLLDELLFRVDKTNMQSSFQESLCQNLTMRETRRQVNHRSWSRHNVYRDAMANFWFHFGDDPPQFASSLLEGLPLNETLPSIDFLRNNRPEVQYRGISLDLVQIDFDLKSMERIIATLDLMHLLDFNILQLCIMNDLGFAVSIPKHPELAWGDSAPFTKAAIDKIVTHAESLGIYVIPQFTTATRAGGWFSAGILANCPTIMCERGFGMGANATDATLLGVTISLMHQLLEMFHHPPYLHLGYDERVEVQACYEEAELKVDLDNFERRLIEALKFQDFNVSKLIRWENEEGVIYPTRAGEVTHYRSKLPPKQIGNPDSFFISSGLNFGEPEFSNITAWGVFERTRKLLEHKPTGILATVELVHEAFWRDFSVVRRLVAFSMGLSSSDWTSEPDFQKSLDSILSVLEVEEELGGDIPDAITSQNHLVKHRLFRTQSACYTRTLTVSVELPKQGVFAEEKR